MKNVKTILVLLIPAMLLFAGCPESIAFPAAETGTEEVDKTIMGSWETSNADSEFKKITFTKKDKYSLKAVVADVSTDYNVSTKEFTVWTTTIEGQKFLSAKANLDDAKSYYIYRYEYVGDDLITYEITFPIEQKKKILSIENLRERIKMGVKSNSLSRYKAVWKKK